jgi:pimeloyl-ACP methyl ester carboxylesterase
MTEPDRYGAPMTFDLRDGAIAARCWPRPGAPRLLFAHATGFCASAYRAMLTTLSEQFEVVAIDLRGHGRSALPADPAQLHDISPFVRDLGEVLDRLAARAEGRVLLAGHSLGASAALMAARGRRDVAGLALIEPVVIGELIACFAATPAWPLAASRIPLVKGARARRAVWPDRAAARAGYARKALFAHWAEGGLDDYLEDGLVEREDGGVGLACAPDWEAAIFATQKLTLWRAAKAAPAPIRVLVADHPSTTVGEAARRRFRRLGAGVEAAAAVSHLMPFERPDLAARFIAGAVHSAAVQ